MALLQYQVFLKNTKHSEFEIKKVAEIKEREEQVPGTLKYYFVDDILKD